MVVENISLLGVEDLTRIHDAFNEHDIITNVVLLVKNAELSKLWATWSYVHVGPWALKAAAFKCWFKRLDDVLAMVLIWTKYTQVNLT